MPISYNLVINVENKVKLGLDLPVGVLVKSLISRCKTDASVAFPWEEKHTYSVSFKTEIGGSGKREVWMDLNNPLWVYNLEDVSINYHLDQIFKKKN